MSMSKSESVRHKLDLPKEDLEALLRQCFRGEVPEGANFWIGEHGASFVWSTSAEHPVVEAKPEAPPEPRVVDFVFDTDGAEGPMGGRLVEVEDADRRSVRVGEWFRRDGRDVLRVKVER